MSSLMVIPWPWLKKANKIDENYKKSLQRMKMVKLRKRVKLSLDGVYCLRFDD